MRLTSISIILLVIAAWLPVAAQSPPSTGQAQVAEFEALLHRIEDHRAYLGLLQQVIDDQERQLDALAKDQELAPQTRRALPALLVEMTGMLSRVVADGLPFNEQERQQRIQQLERVLSSAELDLAARTRVTANAFRVEMDYGRALTTESIQIDRDGSALEVDALAFGNLLLVYQTTDRSETGFFNPQTRAWQVLPKSYATDVATALRIAKRQAAPELLRLPVVVPQR